MQIGDSGQGHRGKGSEEAWDSRHPGKLQRERHGCAWGQEKLGSAGQLFPHTEVHFLGLSSAVKTGGAQADPSQLPSGLQAGRNRRGVWSLDNMSLEASAPMGPCVDSAED